MTDPPPAAPGGDADPTLMANQPSLTTASGTIWIVVGALFVAACAYPMSALLFVEPGEAFPVAVVTAVVIVVLYLLIVATRFAVPRGRRRLRRMAAFFIAMVAVAVIGLFACAVIQWSVLS